MHAGALSGMASSYHPETGGRYILGVAKPRFSAGHCGASSDASRLRHQEYRTLVKQLVTEGPRGGIAVPGRPNSAGARCGLRLACDGNSGRADLVASTGIWWRCGPLRGWTKVSTHFIAPHGRRLVQLLAPSAERETLRAGDAGLPLRQFSPRPLCGLARLATGAFSPLDRFMGAADYERVIADGARPPGHRARRRRRPDAPVQGPRLQPRGPRCSILRIGSSR